MEIRIQLDHPEPPAGRLCVVDRSGVVTHADTDADADTVEFAGWLGLLRALSGVLQDVGEMRAGPE